MATKADLQSWVHEALKAAGGTACLVDVAKAIWHRYETDLKASGDLLFTWQYDMRWAANRLRRQGIMKAVDDSPRGIWELTK